MARSQQKTARANEPANPATEVHGDGTQVVRNHLGLSIYEHVVIEMAKGIVSSPDTHELTFDEVADRAAKQAEAIIERIAVRS